ncbi:MAG: cupin domain-containing protein [Candidatus Paceibacterota bacterium]
MNNLHEFQSAVWAIVENGVLIPKNGKQPIKMAKSDATALPLLFDGSGEKPFGASLIRFTSGEKVDLHTHIGSHILIVTYGQGLLTYFSKEIKLGAGMMYLIPSEVPHAIRALSELVIIAVGNDFRAEGSENRLNLVREDNG